MVDGILSSGHKSTYELPSQAELIQRAFAGDDVEEDFVKQKEAVLDEENPEPEKPILLPGWGQWTSVQEKRGLPSWMLKEHEAAKQKRSESLKKRKDAHLNNVIISEKLGKKVSLSLVMFLIFATNYASLRSISMFKLDERKESMFVSESFFSFLFFSFVSNHHHFR